MRGRTSLLGAALVAALAMVTGCGQGGDDEPTASASPPTGSGTASAPQSPSPAPTAFNAEVKRVTADDLEHSWRRGCPVPVSGLRMIEMTYWGMDDRPHTDGRLVVNARVADDLVKVFRTLYRDRYPINKIEPIDAYEGSDFQSIRDNNTSAFNCRQATGSGSWSQHAYGLAVDLNPCENPYVSASGRVAHPNCVKFKDRSRDDPGLIKPNDNVVKAFRSIGWGWGGTWSGIKDYQHFSSNGR